MRWGGARRGPRGGGGGRGRGCFLEKAHVVQKRGTGRRRRGNAGLRPPGSSRTPHKPLMGPSAFPARSAAFVPRARRPRAPREMAGDEKVRSHLLRFAPPSSDLPRPLDAAGGGLWHPASAFFPLRTRHLFALSPAPSLAPSPARASPGAPLGDRAPGLALTRPPPPLPLSTPRRVRYASATARARAGSSAARATTRARRASSRTSLPRLASRSASSNPGRAACVVPATPPRWPRRTAAAPPPSRTRTSPPWFRTARSRRTSRSARRCARRPWPRRCARRWSAGSRSSASGRARRAAPRTLRSASRSRRSTSWSRSSPWRARGASRRLSISTGASRCSAGDAAPRFARTASPTAAATRTRTSGRAKRARRASKRRKGVIGGSAGTRRRCTARGRCSTSLRSGGDVSTSRCTWSGSTTRKGRRC